MLSLTIPEPRNFLKLEFEITGEEMGLEKMVFEKNNFIRPANRKTRMLFCQENRNWTKEDWKKLFSSDETMVVIKMLVRFRYGEKVTKNMFHI